MILQVKLRMNKGKMQEILLNIISKDFKSVEKISVNGNVLELILRFTKEIPKYIINEILSNGVLYELCLTKEELNTSLKNQMDSEFSIMNKTFYVNKSKPMESRVIQVLQQIGINTLNSSSDKQNFIEIANKAIQMDNINMDRLFTELNNIPIECRVKVRLRFAKFISKELGTTVELEDFLRALKKAIK